MYPNSKSNILLDKQRGKLQRNLQADFPKIISQKSRFLMILSTDFAEKLSDSRKMHLASDGSSERSGKFFLAENDQGYGPGL